MKLYIGSRDYKPDGFLTVDIDPKNQPDVLADAADLHMVATGTVDEVCASAILEHIVWPRAYLALSEWVRVLKPGGVIKISVPDLAVLCSHIARGVNVHQAIGTMYGVGRRNNKFEAHQYGYTRGMLVDMLTVLGISNFDWWSSPVNDASNGWGWDEFGEKIALSINIAGKKTGEPSVDTAALIQEIESNDMAPFMVSVSKVANGSAVAPSEPQVNALLFQRIHFQLIEAHQRIKYLENQIAELRQTPTPVSPPTAEKSAVEQLTSKIKTFIRR